MAHAKSRRGSKPAPGAQAAALLQRALECHRQGQLPQAAELYQAMLALQPNHFDALHLLGVIEHQQGHHARAADLIRQAIAQQPEQAEPYSNLGLVLQAQNLYEEALESYTRALALKPAHAESHNNRGNVWRKLGRYEEALAAYDRALSIKPDYAVAHSNRGNVLQDLKRHQEALVSYQQALSYQPNYPEALNNRAQAWRYLNQTEAALEGSLQALQLRPDYASAFVTCGNVLQDLLRHPEALPFYQRAQELRPDDAEAHLNEALCRLSLGDFTAGWDKYEWRWASSTHNSARRDFPQPLWQGQVPLAGLTLLLHAEQGLGDTLQFCRFVPQLAAAGAIILLEVQAPLYSLLSGLPGVARLLVQGEPLPHFDYHCPLMSLPRALRLEVATIPRQVPYLHADPLRIATWRTRLAAYPKPWIGLAWSGNPHHVNDHNRSVPLAALAPVLRAPGSLFAIQTPVAPAERAIFREMGGIDLIDELHDFSDTAGLLACLDYVVTADTAAVHLAGALARPTCLLLPYNADFRWLIGRPDTPWYPTVQLLRQNRRGDWTELLQRLAKALGAQL